MRTPIFRNLTWLGPTRTGFWLILLSHFSLSGLLVKICPILGEILVIIIFFATEIVFNKGHCTQHKLCKNRATQNLEYANVDIYFSWQTVNKRSPYEFICGKEWGEVPS
jgi:hypothetical protein